MLDLFDALFQQDKVIYRHVHKIIWQLVVHTCNLLMLATHQSGWSTPHLACNHALDASYRWRFCLHFNCKGKVSDSECVETYSVICHPIVQSWKSTGTQGYTLFIYVQCAVASMHISPIANIIVCMTFLHLCFFYAIKDQILDRKAQGARDIPYSSMCSV